MSGAKLLNFGTIKEFGNLDFPDLERLLKQRLDAVKALPDLENLIKLLNPLLKAERYGSEELASLKKLRQRAYDQRRNPKFQTKKSSNPITQMASSKFLPPEVGININTVSESKSEILSEETLRAFAGISDEQFVKKAPKLLAWFIASALVLFFLWQQSLALYESAGFTSSIYSAAGGLLMLVGFAAYYSIARSWLGLFFCIYAGAFEGYLMISGTIHNDNQISAIQIQSTPEVIFLMEKADKERTRYHDLKQRYDNPGSKVFKNDWFLKTHINPAWEANLKAHEELVEKKAVLMTASNVEHIIWLKIFYRLGIVFLCMVLVHRFFATWQNKD